MKTIYIENTRWSRRSSCLSHHYKFFYQFFQQTSRKFAFCKQVLRAESAWNPDLKTFFCIERYKIKVSKTHWKLHCRSPKPRAEGSSPSAPAILGKPKKYLGKKPRHGAVFCISKGWISKVTKHGYKMGVLAFRQEVNPHNNRIGENEKWSAGKAGASRQKESL